MPGGPRLGRRSVLVLLAATGAAAAVGGPAAARASTSGAPESGAIQDEQGVATVDTLIGGFESGDEGWAFSLGSEFPGAQGAFARDAGEAKAGDYSGLLTGDFAGGGQYVSISRALPDLDLVGLRLWAASSEAHALTIRVNDSTQQTFQFRASLTPDGDWHEIVVTVADLEGGSHFGGADDGVWHGPARRVFFLLPKNGLGGHPAGGVRIDEVVVEVPALALAVDQLQLGNVFVQPETPQVDVISAGDNVSWVVHDFAGNQVGQGTVAGGATTISLPDASVGYFQLDVTASASGSPIAALSTTYAILSPYHLPTESPFGVVRHAVNSALALAAKAGLKNVRAGIPWESVEPQPGQYNFSAYEPFVGSLADNGLSMLGVMAYTNANYDNGATPYTAAGRAGYAGYAAAAHENFAPTLEWVEVYNEFNLPNFGDRGDGPADSLPEYYYELLKATYIAVKAQSPDTVVVGCATTQVGQSGAKGFAWLESLFQLGGLDYMDVVSVHPYVNANAPELAAAALEELKDLIKQYNGGQLKPIWITEQGWSTYLNGVDEPDQAAYVARAVTIALGAGVEKYFWYELVNDAGPADPAQREQNFGLVRNGADPAGGFTPKPSFVSYAVAVRMLSGAAVSGPEPGLADIYSYPFVTAGDVGRVVWATTERSVAVQTTQPITITDSMGVAATYTPNAGRVHFTASPQPVYLTGPGAGGVIALDSTYQLQTGAATAAQGDPITATVVVDNTGRPEAVFRGTVEIAGVTQAFTAPAGQRTAISVSLPPATLLGDRTLTADIIGRTGRAARLTTSVSIRPPLTVAATHVQRQGNDTLAVTVTSHASRTIELTQLRWQIGALSGADPLRTSLTGGGSRVFDVPMTEAGLGSHEYAVSVVSLDDEASASGTVVMLPADTFTQLTRRGIVVNGAIDDSSSPPTADLATDGTVLISDYGGAADLSGDLWVTWDEDFLCLSAQIGDDVLAQTAVGGLIWQGDSIQFAVAPGLPGESARWSEFGIALTAAGPQIYRFQAADGSMAGAVTDAELAVTRDDASTQTTYELALPWSDLGPIRPADEILSMSVLVNDNDGGGRRGWIEWGSGIGKKKDPALFKPMRLVDAS